MKFMTAEESEGNKVVEIVVNPTILENASEDVLALFRELEKLMVNINERFALAARHNSRSGAEPVME